MSALLLVLFLYNLPRFIADTGSILTLLLLLFIGLIIDTIAHFIIYKRPVCAVSAAVTVLIIYTLSPGAPFLSECAALMAAIVVGKVIWGGTGKNPLNPAMVGLALLAFLTPMHPAFDASFYLLPGVLLSLPFLFIRPYAGIGMIFGMTSSLLLSHNLTAESLISTGVFFWGCLVITDPVTTTSKPAAGLIIGLLAGFIPTVSGFSAAFLPLVILVSNLLSYLADFLKLGGNEKLNKKFGRNQRIKLTSDNTVFIDLTNAVSAGHIDVVPACEEVLRRIEQGRVFGMGGAAFPTSVKIRAALASAAADKHLIINAAECDPGLIHDKWLLEHHSIDIMKGIDILQKCITFKTVTVAAKDFLGVSFPAPVRSYNVTDHYPAGAEKILVQNILKITPENSSPAASGILVLNIQTVYAIYEAVFFGRKADTRYITAADLDKGTAKVVRVKLGAGVRETSQEVLPNAHIIYTGGGMMNARFSDDGAMIDEMTNFLATGQIRPFREAVCSQCNFCSAYCPVSLSVREIAHYVDADALEKASLLHPEHCIECALCSTVCLAGRDQAKRVKTARMFAAAKKSVANENTVC